MSIHISQLEAWGKEPNVSLTELMGRAHKLNTSWLYVSGFLLRPVTFSRISSKTWSHVLIGPVSSLHVNARKWNFAQGHKYSMRFCFFFLCRAGDLVWNLMWGSKLTQTENTLYKAAICLLEDITALSLDAFLTEPRALRLSRRQTRGGECTDSSTGGGQTWQPLNQTTAKKKKKHCSKRKENLYHFMTSAWRLFTVQ